MSDNNPYEAGKTEQRNRGSLPWILLSVFLFAALMFMCFALWRSMTLTQMSRELQMEALHRAEMSRRQAEESLKQAESVIEGE